MGSKLELSHKWRQLLIGAASTSDVSGQRMPPLKRFPSVPLNLDYSERSASADIRASFEDVGQSLRLATKQACQEAAKDV